MSDDSENLQYGLEIVLEEQMYQISNFLDKCRARLLCVCIVIHAVDSAFLIPIKCTVVIYY